MLGEAGGQLVESAPDVEIAPVRRLRGDAALSIAVLGRPLPSARRLPLRGRTEAPLPLRAARRLLQSLRVRLSALKARRLVRQLGYGTVRIFMWDHQMAPRSPRGSGRLRSRVIEALPQRALIIGERGRRTATVLDEALIEAARATGSRLDPGSPSIRTELLIVDAGTGGVLRLAVGPGSRQLLNQRRALSALRSRRIPLTLEDRVPSELAGGRCGVADWSLETKLPGERAGRPVTGTLLSDCVDFLATLHSIHRSTPGDKTLLLDQAEAISRFCSHEKARAVRALAERLEVVLADVPRGFAHGDFFHGNLLVEDGRLTGVIDWDAAGPDRLPLIDLFHLRLTSISEMADDDWGPMLLRHLVPWASTGGGDLVDGYSRLAGLELHPSQVRALVAAYWLDYVSYQLGTHLHQRVRPQWIRRNVDIGSELLAAGLVA